MKDYFAEIVGYEDIKRELDVIRDMIVNPEIYKEMGATMRMGLLLYGEPGTGKTTMANCLIRASERKCFTCRKKTSDGSFIDEIVNTFEKAKENAPAIVFLDDIDKYSDKSPDESEEAEEFATIQSCIDELPKGEVFVLATANNVRKIPKSLKRPGRLGKTIEVRNPRREEIVGIVRHYLAGVKTGDDLDPVSIAMMLQGESCATLEDIIRTSAVKSAYKRQNVISMENIVDACLDLVFDAPECKKPYNEETLRRTAYHEGGHVLVSELLDPGSVSIASIRTASCDTLGLVKYNRKAKEEITFEYYENMLKASLGGKAATEIVYGEPDIGVNSDLSNAFRKAKSIADNYCSYGFQNWIETSDRVVQSDYTAENRNRTMTMIMERNYMEVKQLIVKNRILLDSIATELLKKTTLVHSDIERIMKDAYYAAVC